MPRKPKKAQKIEQKAQPKAQVKPAKQPKPELKPKKQRSILLYRVLKDLNDTVTMSILGYILFQVLTLALQYTPNLLNVIFQTWNPILKSALDPQRQLNDSQLAYVYFFVTFVLLYIFVLFLLEVRRVMKFNTVDKNLEFTGLQKPLTRNWLLARAVSKYLLILILLSAFLWYSVAFILIDLMSLYFSKGRKSFFDYIFGTKAEYHPDGDYETK
jgi:hypothetical protein